MPAVVPSTLNGTFTVFTPTEVALLLEAIKSPARVSNWLKTRMFRHVHMLDFTHTNMRTHFSSNYYTTLLAGPPPWDAFCSTDRFYMFTANRFQLPYIVRTSSGRHKLCVSLCVGYVCIFIYSFLPDEIYWACLPVPAQPFGEQSTQSSDGLSWREAISCMLNGPSEDANISLISHCSHLNEQHHNLRTEWSEML